MGGTSSVVTTDVTNKAITEFTMTLAKECGAGATNNIVFKFGEVGGDFVLRDSTFEQEATVNFACIQDSMTEAQIAQKMAAFLSQQSKTKGNPLSLPWGGVSSEQNLKLYNEVVQKLDMKDIQKCSAAASDHFMVQAEMVGGNAVIENITVSQVAEVISKCKQISDMSAKMASELNTKVEQEGDTEMPSWLEGLFGDFGPLIMGGSILLSCCCCAMVLVALVLFWMNRPKGVGQTLMESVSAGDQ